MATDTAMTHAGDEADSVECLEAFRRHGVHRPIVETHIHFYQPSRPGGVPWPPAVNTTLYRDVLPAEYRRLGEANGVVAAGIVEASPLVEDNDWVLDLVRDDPYYFFFVGSLEIGSAGFADTLAHCAQDRRFAGIRSCLWGSAGITLDAAQLRDLRELARHGLTLDLISRGTTNPKAQVEALCTAVPALRVVIDHLGGAQGAAPAADWDRSLRRLAERCPNLSMKFSSFYDMAQVGDGDAPWVAPQELAFYRPHFDVLMSAFGAERLVWGSNWPVSDLGGGFAEQIRIAEEYLAPFGQQVRDRVMFRNALTFYRRLPRAPV